MKPVSGAWLLPSSCWHRPQWKELFGPPVSGSRGKCTQYPTYPSPFSELKVGRIYLEENKEMSQWEIQMVRQQERNEGQDKERQEGASRVERPQERDLPFFKLKVVLLPCRPFVILPSLPCAPPHPGSPRRTHGTRHCLLDGFEPGWGWRPVGAWGQRRVLWVAAPQAPPPEVITPVTWHSARPPQHPGPVSPPPPDPSADPPAQVHNPWMIQVSMPHAPCRSWLLHRSPGLLTSRGKQTQLWRRKGFPGGSVGKESTCNGGDLVQSLSWEDPLEEDMETHSSILAWRISKDRGAWQAAVPGVAKSRTPLNRWAQHSGEERPPPGVHAWLFHQCVPTLWCHCPKQTNLGIHNEASTDCACQCPDSVIYF